MFPMKKCVTQHIHDLNTFLYEFVYGICICLGICKCKMYGSRVTEGSTEDAECLPCAGFY